MTRRREFNVFSLSFLDIMSCGFGAVILIFVIINHGSVAANQAANLDLITTAAELQRQLQEEQQLLLDLQKNTHQLADQTTSAAQLSELLAQSIIELETRLQDATGSDERQVILIEKLKSELAALEQATTSKQPEMTVDDDPGASLRSISGDGYRQYLTGLNIGGKRILILIDASASMLHQSIVNAIRLSLAPEEQKKLAPKWRRAVSTVEWITANLPPDAEFSLVAFNTALIPLVEDNVWIATSDKPAVDSALDNLSALVPTGGTAMFPPFELINQLSPRPDNIFLIVDGLPTQGENPSNRTVISSPDRAKLFSAAVMQLPAAIPINIILFPMEGDPLATPSYWILAQKTGGSFISPSKDWP